MLVQVGVYLYFVRAKKALPVRRAYCMSQNEFPLDPSQGVTYNFLFDYFSEELRCLFSEYFGFKIIIDWERITYLLVFRLHNT